MKVTQFFKQFFQGKKRTSSNTNLVEQNPNGWGRYEYGGQLFESINNHHFDANSNNNRLGWIQNYANNRLLKAKKQQQKNALVCVNCKTSYRALD
ncbi:MAG: hypothetical protein AAGG68_02765 [Bacteroidota bacterium]